MIEEPIRFAGLEGTLHRPSGDGPHPAIVALHPATRPSRDHFLFSHLARLLPPVGVAVLRFDRRDGTVDRFDEQCADALAAVAALRRHRVIDGSRVGLWGFSQGSWVAPLAASRSADVSFLVLLASSGVSPAVQMRYGTAHRARQTGSSQADLDAIGQLRETLEDYNRGRVKRAIAQAAVDAAADTPWFQHAYVRPNLPERSGFWPTADFEPEPVFARVRAPVLLFYGEEDEWVPVEESIAAWLRAVAAAGNDDVTIVRLEGTGHHPTRGGVEDEREIVPEYERVLVEWLRSRVARRTS